MGYDVWTVAVLTGNARRRFASALPGGRAVASEVSDELADLFDGLPDQLLAEHPGDVLYFCRFTNPLGSDVWQMYNGWLANRPAGVTSHKFLHVGVWTIDAAIAVGLRTWTGPDWLGEALAEDPKPVRADARRRTGELAVRVLVDAATAAARRPDSLVVIVCATIGALVLPGDADGG